MKDYLLTTEKLKAILENHETKLMSIRFPRLIWIC